MQLGLHGEEVGTLFGIAGKVFAEIVVVLLVAALDVEAAEIEAFEFGEQVLEGVEGEVEIGGDFRLGGRTSEFVAEAGRGGFDLAGLAAQIARAPVEFAEAVEDGAADAELGVGLELDLAAFVVAGERIDEAEDAGVDEILDGNVLGKAVMNVAGDVAHLRHLFQEDAVAYFLVDGWRRVVGLRFFMAGPGDNFCASCVESFRWSARE